LARASWLTKQPKIVARLVEKLIELSRVEPSYERVESAHEFLAHGPALRVGKVSVLKKKFEDPS
jgi:hypothetical protein